MKRYRFRLEHVLRVRSLQEEQARQRVRIARMQASAAEAEVAVRSLAYAQRGPLAGPADLDAQMVDRSDWQLTADGVRAARDRAEVAALLVEQRVLEWQVAATKVEALERLDERRRDEHLLDARHEEAVEVDDLVTGRHARRR